ncbi:MAG: PSD1 domain-containing protein [Bryobacterales bacterium]|nr:PSD1 domain-containing protein [Bryobacterales bacterium]
MRFWALLGLVSPLFAAEVSYQREVRPVLAERCAVCHGARNASAGLSVASVAAMVKGGASGAAVKPGDAEGSLLVATISGEKPKMPKVGAPLTAGQVAVIRRWIAEGAKDDSAGAGEETWWSLRPLGAVSVPAEKGWGTTPLDAFLLRAMRAKGLEPSPEADKRTLVRRVYFDLTGLPPSTAEVEAFVRDTAADAWERLVDKLLESPRYGERWARHWLDAAHYGESHGYDKDKPRLNAWPYRDWVIEALNNDKPYARFIQEQVAGDVLWPNDPKALVATGFLAAGPWDFVGHQELREGTVDKDLTRVLDRDDVVAQVMSSVTSMTAHCARCHDHKFDPIPQREYYNLQAVFAGVDRAERPFDDDPAVYARRRALLAEKQAVQRRLHPLLNKVEFASSEAITALDVRIQDASLLLAHLGTPKNAAEEAEKKELEARRVADRAKRKLLVDAIVGPDTYAAMALLEQELKAIDARVAELPKPRAVYAAASYFPRAGNFRPSLAPRAVHVLDRGNVRAPKEEATPGALSCVKGLPANFDVRGSEEGARRAALAQWLTDRGNVLTWRSVVNRVWQHHFGTGIVDSANDFGRMGGKPSHPELLDWLAVWFRDDARGSLKQLHRLIVTSAVYKQSSAQRDDGAKVDAENRLLWRMNRTRLDAEALRDAMLAVAGKLDLTMGGPPVRMFFFKDDHSPVYDYARFDPTTPGANRRSIYRFIVRSVPDPFMDRLDCPDPSVLTAKRSTTITAIQALAVWNNPFVLRMAKEFAARVEAGRVEAEGGGVERAVRLALGREATEAERAEYAAYAKKHGLANLCRVLFNTNEFLFVD